MDKFDPETHGDWDEVGWEWGRGTGTLLNMPSG